MIRKATTDDLPEIYDLITTAATQGKVLKRSMAELGSLIHCFFVYEHEGVLIGCCSLEIYNRKLAEIRSLVVAEAHRSQGIGKALVNACLDEARSKSIYEVLTITDKDTFFEKLGFGKCLNGQYPLFIRP